MGKIKEHTGTGLINCLNECGSPLDTALIITDNKGNEFRVDGVWITQFGQWHPHISLIQVEDMKDRWIQPYWFQAETEEAKLNKMLEDKYKDEILRFKGAYPGSDQWKENQEWYDEIIDDQRRYVERLKQLSIEANEQKQV